MALQEGDIKKKSSSSQFTISKFSYAIDASKNAHAICSLGIGIFLVIHCFLLATNNSIGANFFFPPWLVSLLIGIDMTLVMAIMIISYNGRNPMDSIGLSSKVTHPTYPTSGAWKLVNIAGNVLQTLLIWNKVINVISAFILLYWFVASLLFNSSPDLDLVDWLDFLTYSNLARSM